MTATRLGRGVIINLAATTAARHRDGRNVWVAARIRGRSRRSSTARWRGTGHRTVAKQRTRRRWSRRCGRRRSCRRGQHVAVQVRCRGRARNRARDATGCNPICLKAAPRIGGHRAVRAAASLAGRLGLTLNGCVRAADLQCAPTVGISATLDAHQPDATADVPSDSGNDVHRCSTQALANSARRSIRNTVAGHHTTPGGLTVGVAVICVATGGGDTRWWKCQCSADRSHDRKRVIRVEHAHLTRPHCANAR